MKIRTEQLVKMLDASILKTDNTETDVQALIKTAREYQFICVFSLPCYLPDLVAGVKGTGIHVGAPVGFPTGAETTATKVFQAKTFYDMGCDEFDMVMNVGWLKSGRFEKVRRDIQAVYDAIPGRPLKVDRRGFIPYGQRACGRVQNRHGQRRRICQERNGLGKAHGIKAC